jgi:2-dehydro-3-deoxy-D-gluconate 5-dehydrogenase
MGDRQRPKGNALSNAQWEGNGRQPKIVSPLDYFRLVGKTALVTGASAGIGAAIAVALGEAGADVLCHGNTRSSEHTCESITRTGSRAFALQADLREPDAAASLFERACHYGVPDILINNAGVIRRANAVEYSDEDWNTVLQVAPSFTLEAEPVRRKGPH